MLRVHPSALDDLTAEAGLPQPPVSVPGLSGDEVARRLARDGPNRIVDGRGRGRVRRMLGPLLDPMVALLLVAAVTYVLIGDTADAIIATVAVAPIAGIGWLLEARAEHTLEQLRRLTAPTALVWRDNNHAVVLADELVVGDLVWLREGDVVPADALLVESTQLHVDESALTGEPMPVAKSSAQPRGEADVFAGTTVVSGQALVQVTATGVRTRFGEIGRLVASVRQKPTPLQRAISRLVWYLGAGAAVFCAAVIGAQLAHGSGWGDALIAGVSLAIAAIPEEFAMVYALYLAVGAWRLAREGALIRRLPSVETLGSTTVICVDKTGTLTHGRVTLCGLATVDETHTDVEAPNVAEREVLEAAVLACEPHPYDPLEVAITAYALRYGVSPEGVLVEDHPFDARAKYLTHVWRCRDGSHRVAAKGSIEGILACSMANDQARLAAVEAHASFANRGMRVIAIAAGDLPGGPTGDRTNDEAHLAYLGLVAFDDPVREGVADALTECREAGVRVIMVSGDHPDTAHAVAEGLGLPHDDEHGGDLIATGDQLDRSTTSELEALVAHVNVFARIRPEQKHLIVQALRDQGEIVAMTGDGINDAPALREADIGIAMGGRGTDVARQAATMVLLDDNFSTIVSAVRNGRRIFDNLTNAFAYIVAFHPPLLLGALLIPLVDKPLFLLPVHLVFLELLLHPVVSLVFEADPPAADVMSRRPRSPDRFLTTSRLWLPALLGTTVSIAMIAAYFVALTRWPVDEARAFSFAILLAAQPLLLLSTRSPDRPLWRHNVSRNRTLVIVLTVLALAPIAVVHIPPLAALLKLSAFPPLAWLIVLLVAGATTLWSEPFKHSRPAGQFS